MGSPWASYWWVLVRTLRCSCSRVDDADLIQPAVFELAVDRTI